MVFLTKQFRVQVSNCTIEYPSLFNTSTKMDFFPRHFRSRFGLHLLWVSFERRIPQRLNPNYKNKREIITGKITHV